MNIVPKYVNIEKKNSKRKVNKFIRWKQKKSSDQVLLKSSSNDKKDNS